MNRSFPDAKAILHTTLALMVFLVAGCSNSDFATGPAQPDDSPPLLSQSNVATQSGAIHGGFGISKSPPSLAKRAGSQKHSKTAKKIRARKGGRLNLRNGRTLASFGIPRGALEEDTRISMELIGEGASVLVKFGPEGLEFLKACELTLTFPGEGVDPSTIGGYYIQENGEAIPIHREVTQVGKWIVVKMSIHHFSIYSPGDGEDDEPPPEAEP
jgi:hypothetical protein